MTPFNPKQIYKSRAEAFRLFCQVQSLPVSQAKFYQDADRLKMVRTDKSIELASLLAYVKEELKIDPATGQSLAERSIAAKKDELDIKERELKIAKLEREGRKDDKEWIHRDKVNEREGALVGGILVEGKYQLSRVVPAVIALCKGDPDRKNEVASCLEEALYSAFRTFYEAGEIDIAYEDIEE